MSEIFPTRTRSTGMNVSYNIAVTLFGGFAPLWNESLIALTRTTLAPSFYLMFVACLSLLSLTLVRRHFAVR
jgi:MHS family proline/betaine transporter-like MFS transporter